MFEVQDEIVQKEIQAVEFLFTKGIPTALDMLKAMAAWLADNGDATFIGKQSVENLAGSGNKLATLPLSSKNIKDFVLMPTKFINKMLKSYINE